MNRRRKQQGTQRNLVEVSPTCCHLYSRGMHDNISLEGILTIKISVEIHIFTYKYSFLSTYLYSISRPIPFNFIYPVSIKQIRVAVLLKRLVLFISLPAQSLCIAFISRMSGWVPYPRRSGRRRGCAFGGIRR